MKQPGLVVALWLASVVAAPGLSAQCPDGSPPPCRQPVRPPAPAANSVAVLYFDNLSPDTADAYLADGLSDEIASRLGNIARLSVKQASREGIRRLRENAPDYHVAAGRVLGVRYLVEGSLLRGGPRIRVDVRLVNATSGFRVWGQIYDRAASDLLDLQEAIAQEVATSIGGQLAPVERLALARRPTTNPDAYEHFLRGNYYLAKRSTDGFRRAVAEYESASRIDPLFTRAIARAGLAYELSYEYAGRSSPSLPRDSLLARAAVLITRAFGQDSTAADAWVASAYQASFLHPRSFQGVIIALERALALDPHNAEEFHQYGFFLRVLGQDSAAQAACLRSLAIEPERPITLSALGFLSFLERRYDESRRWLDSSLRIDPEFYWGYVRRARTRLMLGDAAGAQADAEMALRKGDVDSTLGLALLAMARAQQGDTATARTLLGPLRRAPPDTTWDVNLEEHLLPAAALVTTGDREAALSFLEHAQPHGARLWSGLRAAEFDPLRSDPRFQRLVEESRP